MTSQPTLTHQSVILRPWRQTDADDLHREIQDPEIVRWLDIELPYTLHDASSFIAKATSQDIARDGAHYVITTPRQDFVGYIGVLPVDPPKTSIEIVYWVAAAHRRRGHAADAVRALLPWLAGAIPDHEIEINMTAGNHRSAHVAHAVGFHLHATAPGGTRLEGQAADIHFYRHHQPPVGTSTPDSAHAPRTTLRQARR